MSLFKIKERFLNLYSGLFSSSSRRYYGDDLIPIPWGTRFFIIFIALLILGGSLQLDKTLVCNGQYSYCTLESHNYFNIKKSKKVFIPKEVSLCDIESYQKRSGSRYHRTMETKHLVKLIDKTGKSVTIFTDYYDYARANDAKQRIMECIEHGPYPCKVKR